MKQSWRTYEEVATYLLSQFAKEFGLARVEGKQKIAVKRGDVGSENNLIEYQLTELQCRVLSNK